MTYVQMVIYITHILNRYTDLLIIVYNMTYTIGSITLNISDSYNVDDILERRRIEIQNDHPNSNIKLPHNKKNLFF